ncbi:MAG: multiheme c-type cytochrome [Myxococcota bacterium]
MEETRAAGPAFVVDAGNLYWKSPTLAQGMRPQQERKAALIAEAFALAGVDAMAPGAGDLALGIDFVKGLVEKHHLPYVAANLECPGKGAPFAPFVVAEKGGVTLAFVGVVGETVKHSGCAATDPVAAVRAAIAGVEADAFVVLSNEKIEDDERLAAAVPEIGLVVNGQERRQLPTPKGLSNGGLLLASGSRGKQLGVLKISLVAGASQWRDDDVRDEAVAKRDKSRARVEDLEARREKESDGRAKDRLQKQIDFFEREIAEAESELARLDASSGPAHAVKNSLRDLGTDVKDHPKTAELVAAAKVALGETVTETTPALPTSPYAGSAACAACHAPETTQWKGTAHARAYASLKAANREKDQDCFSCHVTGASHPQGPQQPGAVAGLEDVGCESCHGPGKAHVADPKAPMTRDPAVETCTTCHDGKQDGGRFDFGTYRPKVVHG